MEEKEQDSGLDLNKWVNIYPQISLFVNTGNRINVFSSTSVQYLKAPTVMVGAFCGLLTNIIDINWLTKVVLLNESVGFFDSYFIPMELM